jgi:phosphoadenosine phosphosulfate reductase
MSASREQTPSPLEGWAGIDTGDARAILGRALDLYHPAIALASSFSLEDVTLIDLLASLRDDIRVFALDTGRLNPETYECAEAIRRCYGLEVEWYFPRHETVEDLERTKGLFSFRESIEERKACCFIRKVEPLNRALEGLDAWITGMRREQAVTRGELPVAEKDPAHGNIVKINPLAEWSLDDVWAHVRKNMIPYNPLHDRGYPSIGCAPCTRAIRPGEDLRSGRWWWEQPEHKECGLHLGVDRQQGAGI